MKRSQGAACFRVEWASHAHSWSDSLDSQSQARIQKVNRDYVCTTHATPVYPFFMASSFNIFFSAENKVVYM